MTEEQNLKRFNYQACFASDAGKKVLEDLGKQCFYKRDLFNKDSARITDYNLGANWVIRYIHSQIEERPKEKQEKAIKENTDA